MQIISAVLIDYFSYDLLLCPKGAPCEECPQPSLTTHNRLLQLLGKG